MTVRVVTDSTADLDQVTASSLGISIVPTYVRWESEIYRDGVDLTPSQFYARLAESETHPATAQPGPDDFSEVYRCLADAEGIVSIHISSKISGTCNSARLARERIPAGTTPIEVIDSGLNSAGLGLVVLAAARAAAEGASFHKVVEETRHAAAETRMVGLFDTMKYLARSGRISPTRGLAGRVLRVKPLLTFRDGEIVRAGLARSRESGIRQLLRLLGEMTPLRQIIVSHSTSDEEVGAFVQRANELHPPGVSHVFQMGAALGVHGGPGMIIVGVRVK